jgi:spermidine/putrescine transport system permease protein
MGKRGGEGHEAALSNKALRKPIAAPNLHGGGVLAFIFMPLVTIAVFSFNADRFPSLPWAGFSLTWYQAVFADPTIARGLANSLIVAAATAIISTLLGIGAAYVDYRYRFVGKGIYTALMTLPPTIPVVILGLAMLTFEGRIGITGTLSGIVAGHVVLCMPFALALVRLRLADLDPNLEAASWNLGATRWTTMRDVIIPFCRPAIIAALFLTAAISFDEFMIAWFISGLNETLPVRLLAMLQGQVSPRINAVGTMVFSVSIGLVVLAQLVIGRRLRMRAAGLER